MKRVAIALFRNDLRMHDNPMLLAALQHANKAPGGQGFVLPFFAFDSRQIDCSPLNDKTNSDKFEPALTWEFKMPRCQNYRAKFLVESVMDLQKRLRAKGSDLLVRYGITEKLVQELVAAIRKQEGEGQVDVEVFCAVEVTYEETKMEQRMRSAVRLNLLKGSHTLVHPDDVPFKHCPRVFTSFRKDCEQSGGNFIRDPLEEPKALPPTYANAASFFKPEQKDDWMSSIANLSMPFDKRSMVPYKGGETTGLQRLHHFVHEGGANAPVFHYKQTRNSLAGLDDSTHFSAWLANGSLSPRSIAKEISQAEAQFGSDQNSYWVIFELLWRDYFKYLFADTGDTLFHLYGFKEPAVQQQQDAPSKQNKGGGGGGKGHQDRGQQKMKKENQLETPLPEWTRDQERYDRWVQGMTGVPFIDANMRELRQTGYMSNRGRQNVCSFLADQLEVDWRWGAEHFEAYLIDHDVCSNTGNWAYGAGVGTDPRNRTFNILKQAQDYDSHGEYVKAWVPELRDVPAEHVQHPWTMSQGERSKCGGGGGGGLQGYPVEPVIVRGEWKKQAKRLPGEGNRQGKANPSEKSNNAPKHHHH